MTAPHAHSSVRAVVAGMVAALTLSGCSSEPESGAVILQLATRRPAVVSDLALVRAAGDSAVVTLGNDTIVVRHGWVVVRLVALQPSATWECDPEHPCADIEPGPVLFELPLVDHPTPVLEARVKATAYAVFQVQVHRPNPEADSRFMAAHPNLPDASVRLEGTYSRAGARRDFVLSSHFNEIQELQLVPMLRVEAGDTVRLTLRMDVARVFLNEQRDALLDPTGGTPGGPDEYLVRDNIRLALAAFRDENQDGLDDHRPPQQEDTARSR